MPLSMVPSHPSRTFSEDTTGKEYAVMESQDDQLSDYLFQIESSPWRAEGAEIPYLRTQLKMAEDELHKLDSDLAILLANRSRVIKRINRCRTSLAPYSKLPIELIQQIIQFCIPGKCNLPLLRGRSDPRLRITQICSSWRKAAFGISVLWDVHLKDVPGENTVKLIAAWFHQCFSMHLTLTTSSSRNDYRLYGGEGPLLEEVVIPYARRLRTLDCSPLLTLDHVTSLPFDVLTTLSLRFRLPQPISKEFLNAPFLRNLCMTDIAGSLNGHCEYTILQCLPQIPWKKLTSISLSGWLDPTELCEVLSLCHSLEDCNLNGVGDTYRVLSGNIHTATACNLPRLKKLWIAFSSPQFFRNLFLLDTPNLTSLAITLPPDEPEILKRFAWFVEARAKTLRSFECIKEHRRTNFPIDIIMRVLPLVTRFVAKGRHIALTTLARVGEKELLPKLEGLEFAPEGNVKVDDILDALIPQQSNKASSFTDIRICINHFGSDRRMNELRSRGINISLYPPFSEY